MLYTAVMTRKLLFIVTAALALNSCAGAKPIVRTIHDVAKSACAIFFADKQGLSIEDAARTFCATEAQLRPWIDEVLKAQQIAGAAALQQQSDAGE